MRFKYINSLDHFGGLLLYFPEDFLRSYVETYFEFERNPASQRPRACSTCRAVFVDVKEMDGKRAQDVETLEGL